MSNKVMDAMLSNITKDRYENELVDLVKRPSPFLVHKSNPNKVMIPEPKKRVRSKRKPKGTIAVYALFTNSAEDIFVGVDDLIDLTFSKVEAKDWEKQDDDHFYNIFYVKELDKVEKVKKQIKRRKDK